MKLFWLALLAGAWAQQQPAQPHPKIMLPLDFGVFSLKTGKRVDESAKPASGTPQQAEQPAPTTPEQPASNPPPQNTSREEPAEAAPVYDRVTITGVPGSFETHRTEEPTYEFYVPRGFYNRISLMIAIPCYGGNMHSATVHSLWRFKDIAEKLGMVVSLQVIWNESLIQRARNTLVQMFMDMPDYSHFMFIDSDIEFSPGHIIRMLSKDKDVICALYPKKSYDVKKIVDMARNFPGLTPRQIEAMTASYFGYPVLNPDNTFTVEDQVTEVTQCGTGFLLIKRPVFTTMMKAYPGLKHRDKTELATTGGTYSDNYYYLFEAGPDPETGRYLSEDYYFIKRWRDIGGKVHADLNVSLTHFGTHAFIGRPSLYYINPNKVLESARAHPAPSEGIRVEDAPHAPPQGQPGAGGAPAGSGGPGPGAKPDDFKITLKEL